MRCCFIETRDRIVLVKIIDYCGRIENIIGRCKNNIETFMNDTVYQDACCMCVVQIGELVGQLSEEAKRKNKVIPWRAIKDTRNFYVHCYGSVDLQSVWETLVQDIPVLHEACNKLLKEL